MKMHFNMNLYNKYAHISKGSKIQNYSLHYFMRITERNFGKKFENRYEGTVPHVSLDLPGCSLN